ALQPQRKPGPHQHESGKGRETCDGLAGESVVLTGMDVAEPRPSPPSQVLIFELLPLDGGAGFLVQRQRRAKLRLSAVSAVDRKTGRTLTPNRQLENYRLPVGRLLLGLRKERIDSAEIGQRLAAVSGFGGKLRPCDSINQIGRPIVGDHDSG